VRGGRVLRFWVKLFIVGFVFALAFGVVPRGFAVSSAEASASVAGADHALRAAFISALDAEQSGANVTALLVRLDDAGVDLTRAEAALGAGNYSDAASLAVTCTSLANGVSVDAGVLKGDAVATAGNWWMTVAFSVVGSVVFAVVLLFVWRRFRAGYVKRMMRSRPEVTG
jgi:hypothetical protein